MQDSIWKKFPLNKAVGMNEVVSILEDYAFKANKKDRSEYKQATLKTIWNTTAKLVEQLYFTKFNITMIPFMDIDFESARKARDSRRKKLQAIPEKRKISSCAIDEVNYKKVINHWDEDTPSGLQKKNYLIAAKELAWRGGKGAYCLLHYFKSEVDSSGNRTGHYEYNSIFSKTRQGGASLTCESKCLIPNRENPNLCPVGITKEELGKG
ncbi:hypothetical protein Zmor_011283 [Zophobas morio]|uniref:Uncharacterized protein n=1 Tax=Zophobas morio TaxID=2755281 RepID=A0AA38MKA5_9CUCU|nr:hypothetical protein Zmor_011283 [Zophobas morio]